MSCVLGVWLGCIIVVPTTTGKCHTLDSKENKQADAGSHLFSKKFSVRRVVVELILFISRRERGGPLYLHIYKGNVQKKNPAESCVNKDLPNLPRFSPTIIYRNANSVLEQNFVHY